MDIGQMNCKFRNEISYHGHSLDELKSGLQKYVRRSMHQQALYCAAELDLFAELGHEAERIRTNFIHRLMIIFMEDVGIGGFGIWPKLHRLSVLLLAGRKKSNRSRPKEIEAVCHWIHLMIHTDKARVCSHLNNLGLMSQLSQNLVTGTKLAPIHSNVDRCKDQATLILRIKECLASENPIKRLQSVIYANRLEDQAIMFKLLSPYASDDIIEIGQAWYKEIKTKEKFLTWNIILASVLFGVGKPRILPVDLLTSWDDHKTKPAMEFNEYVMDKHTRRGTHRETSYFALNGAYVSPESPLVNPWLKWLYHRCRDIEEDPPTTDPWIGIVVNSKKSPGIVSRAESATDEKKEDVGGATPKKVGVTLKKKDPMKESEFGEFQFRIQLTTSANKTDVYLVVSKDTKQPLIVKGPYQDAIVPTRFLELQTEKSKYGLPVVKCNLVWMMPDRWSDPDDQVPLGYRRRIDLSKPYPFLVTESVIPLSKYVTRTHSSKLWKPTVVIDPEKTDLHVHMLSVTGQSLVDLYGAIAFRIKHGLTDLAERNFLQVGDRVISVDEESTGTVDLLTELKKNRFEYLKSHWKDHRSKVHPDLQVVLDPLLNVSSISKSQCH